MSAQLARCPACQAECPPQATICDTCGRVLADAARTTRPILATQPVVAARPAAPLPPAMLPAAPPLAGQALAHGRYTIQHPLSQGGMGAIYLATDHEAFGRTVVIKALLGDAEAGTPAEAQAARARFEREARTLAALSYPTIPQIFSYFQDLGQYYIVMAYVEGRDLAQDLTRHDPATRQVIAGQPYPLRDVLHWGVALCRTLEYLAGRTPPVVHQDIKPANLILNSGSRELFLVDFGAARARHMAPAGNPALTAVFGTPGYAAPEQYQAQSEPRSDVYALAATLYHLITDDDPSAHPFDFPRLPFLGYLGPILRAALGPDCAARPSATELREQLEALLTPEKLRALRTPDGQDLLSENELTRWCELNWQQAADWLYDDMPKSAQIAWVKPALAEDLRRCVRTHPSDHDAGLDAVLAQFDHGGFAAAKPLFTCDSARIGLELFVFDARHNYASGQVTVRNCGRRYARASVVLPRWASCPTTDVVLAPGEHFTLDLEVAPHLMPTELRGAALNLRGANGMGLAVPFEGSLPLVPGQADPKQGLIFMMILFAIIFALVLVSMLTR